MLILRKLSIICLSLLSLNSALAQNNQIPTQSPSFNAFTNNWWGLTSGYINSSYPFGFALHFGVKNPQGPDLRISGSFQFRDGSSSLGFGVDALTPFAEVLPLSVYGGGGGAILFEDQSFLFDAHGLVGTQYSFSDYDLEEIGLFLEIRLGAALAVGENIPQPAVPSAGAVLGVNFFF